MTKRVIFPTGPDALQRERLQVTPEIWEDGLRIDPQPGNFEWWYFDAHFDDGSTAVINFFTKSPLDRSSRLNPGVSVSITRADGKKLSETSPVLPAEFSASKERCYVRAGKSWVRGDLCTYELDARVEGLAAQLTFTGIVPPWRPGVGKNYYDEAQTRFFGWFPAIPYGNVEGYITYEGKIHNVKGYCYHDHNWGNVGLNDVLTHWYWGRAHVGEYTLIFAEMNATASYGKQKVPMFLLAKGSQILIADGAPLSLEEQDFIADPGGRSYPDGLDLAWKENDQKIHLSLRSPKLIESFSLLENLPTLQRLVGSIIVNPYYFRFHADLDLQIDLVTGSGRLQDHKQGLVLYELMLLR